jgi:hypothetical protein
MLLVLSAFGAGCSSGSTAGTSNGTSGGSAGSTSANSQPKSSGASSKAYCADATKLKADLEALVSFDLIAQGADAMNVQVKTVRDDFERLRVSANGVAKAELDVLERSLTGLDTSIGKAGSGEVSKVSFADVMRSAASALTAGAAVASKLADSCG